MARTRKTYPPRQCGECGLWQEMNDKNAIDPDPCLGRIGDDVTFACCGHNDPTHTPYVSWKWGPGEAEHPDGLYGQAALDWFASRGLGAPRTVLPEVQARYERNMAHFARVRAGEPPFAGPQ